MSGIRSLAAAGLLDERVVAAHCVKVDEEEIGLLAGHGVAVAHCPRSNALLGCGIAPLDELRAAGLRVGIGTDGVSSVPSHDFFEELRAVISLARARSERADALSATEALELATLGGARALGLDERDRLARPRQARRPRPSSRFPARRIYHGRIRRPPWSTAARPERVTATLVDGETRYERGGSEWHELIDAASRSARSHAAATASATAIS